MIRASRAVLIILAAHAALYLLHRQLGTAITPAGVFCRDSPTPGLCALLYGQALAAGRASPGANQGGGAGIHSTFRVGDLPRREGDNEGGGSSSATSSGVGGRHLPPPSAVETNLERCGPWHTPCYRADWRRTPRDDHYRADTRPLEPPPLPDWPVDLRYTPPPLPPDPCGGPCVVRGPWLAPQREEADPSENYRACQQHDRAACRRHAAWFRSLDPRGAFIRSMIEEYDRLGAEAFGPPAPPQEPKEKTAWSTPPPPSSDPSPSDPDGPHGPTLRAAIGSTAALRRAIAEGLAAPFLAEPQPSPPPGKQTASGAPSADRPNRHDWRSRGCTWWPQ